MESNDSGWWGGEFDIRERRFGRVEEDDTNRKENDAV
jgi:hypothetical protein